MSAASPLLPDEQGRRPGGVFRTRRAKTIAGAVAVTCAAALVALAASIALVQQRRSVLVADDDSLDFRLCQRVEFCFLSMVVDTLDAVRL
jgi:hypothetical protein